MMISRVVLVVFLLGTLGCSATYISASTTDNPLNRVEENAQEDWSTERIDANTLHLRNVWPMQSFWSLCYSASHPHLVYDSTDGLLHVQYYLWRNSPLFLFIPSTHDAESPDCTGRGRCWYGIGHMNEEIKDILKWSGASVISRRAVPVSETFPPPRPISSAPTN